MPRLEKIKKLPIKRSITSIDKEKTKMCLRPFLKSLFKIKVANTKAAKMLLIISDKDTENKNKTPYGSGKGPTKSTIFIKIATINTQRNVFSNLVNGVLIV